jgi:hypothetical protein
MQFPINRTVRLTGVPLTGVRLTGTEYTNLISGQQGVQLTRSPDDGSLVNKFRREVPIYRTVGVYAKEC